MPSPDPFLASAQTEGVPSSFAAARDGVDAVLSDRGLRRSTPEMTAESLLRGALANAALDGSDAARDAFERRLAMPAGDAATDDGELPRAPEVAAAIRVSSELLGLVPVIARSPLQACARLHAVAAGGELPDADRGRPINPAGTRRLQRLAAALTTPTEAPAMVIAAVAHAEIAASAAFASHNRLIARCVERLLLVQRGVDPAALTVPEAGHAAEPGAYEQALAEYADGEAPTPGAMQGWLLYASDAYARGARFAPVE